MYETLCWNFTAIDEQDLLKYIQSARSISAFAGMCDRGNADDMYNILQSDLTTINAINVLHANQYDTERALQIIVDSPKVKSIEQNWSDEEQKKFVKGLRQFGKNFFRIRQELLPDKESGDLVEY